MASAIYYIILLHQKAQSFSLGIYHPYLRDRETTKQISSGLEENQFFINTSNPFLSNNSRYFYNYFPEKRNRPKQESSAHIFMDFRINIFPLDEWYSVFLKGITVNDKGKLQGAQRAQGYLDIQSRPTVQDIEISIPNYNLILMIQKRTSEGRET